MSSQDKELLQELKEDKERAFDKLFRKYYEGLVLVAIRYIQRKDLAEEIVQDVLLRIWENRFQLTDSLNLGAYLYSSVRNQCIDYIRKNQVRDKYVKAALKEDKEYAEQKEERYDKERLKHIKNVINSLPKKRQRIFKLNRYWGLKYSEIAQKLGISEKTVENQMGMALKQLREKLKDFRNT